MEEPKSKIYKDLKEDIEDVVSISNFQNRFFHRIENKISCLPLVTFKILQLGNLYEKYLHMVIRHLFTKHWKLDTNFVSGLLSFFCKFFALDHNFLAKTVGISKCPAILDNSC